MKLMALRNYIFMLKNKKFQLIVGIILIIFALSIEVHAAKAAVAFPYDSVSVREIEFNQFEVTFNSSSGFTPGQIENAIIVSGEKSNNIKIKNIIKNDNTYTIYGSLNDYSIRFNKLFNPWLNGSWESRTVYNISNFQLNFPVNITTGYNKSDRWINCADNIALPYWNETSENKVWVNLTVATNQICKYVNSTDFYHGNENGNATFDFFDNFQETGIDTTKWTITQSSVGNVDLINGAVRIIGNSNWDANGINTIPIFKNPYNVHYSEGVGDQSGYATSIIANGVLVNPNSFGLTNYFNTVFETVVLNGTNKNGLGESYSAGVNYSNRISIKSLGWRWYKNQTLKIDNNTDTVRWNRFQSQTFSPATKLYIDNVFAYPFYDPEPKATIYQNETYLNVISWNNSLTNNLSLALNFTDFTQFYKVIAFNMTSNNAENITIWNLNNVIQSSQAAFFSYNFTSNGTYTLNATAVSNITGLNQSVNWTISILIGRSNIPTIFIVPTPVSNCGPRTILNLTNLAPTIEPSVPGTGDRTNATTYYTNNSEIELLVFAHAMSISETAGVFIYFNNTLVMPQSGRPLGGAETAYRGSPITVPRGTYYRVEFINYHHYEWRESKRDLDISGCIYPSNNDSLNNVISSISSGLALLFAIIALAICLKKKKK